MGCLLFCFLCFFESLCQLIWTGGGFHSAMDTFDTVDDIIYIHTFHQGADTLQVSVTAAKEFYIFQLTIFNFKKCIY